ncbi:MAG: hypothetical protein NC187_06220 [Candidatus Amulumruptor caecigallinarius]|nr:hypothetical protein [Candidatus Amulumruptor caecigallinarius]MCM1397065.1 hypothetical protein [Candidatus Amulumruptor caecigallinarius]MCM1454013.1 hypothetical protein [bacterium]
MAQKIENQRNIGISGVNFEFSEFIPDSYTADCLDLPFSGNFTKIKIAENG